MYTINQRYMKTVRCTHKHSLNDEHNTKLYEINSI